MNTKLRKRTESKSEHSVGPCEFSPPVSQIPTEHSRLYRILIVLAFCFHIHIPNSRAGSPVPGAVDDAAELTGISEQQKAVYRSLNGINPLSKDFQKNLPGAHPSAPAGMPPALIGVISKLEGFISNPRVQEIFHVFSDPAFAITLEQIMKNPKLNSIPQWEFGWLVFFIFFKGWRSSKMAPANWIGKVWLNLWSLGLYVTISSFVIPWQLLGDPFYKIFAALIFAAFKIKI